MASASLQHMRLLLSLSLSLSLSVSNSPSLSLALTPPLPSLSMFLSVYGMYGSVLSLQVYTVYYMLSPVSSSPRHLSQFSQNQLNRSSSLPFYLSFALFHSPLPPSHLLPLVLLLVLVALVPPPRQSFLILVGIR